MNSDPDQVLHRLVVAALTVFVVVSLLLAAFVAREIWLQQRIVALSSSLQTNIEELEETTEEIQNQVTEIETSENAPEAQELDNMNELLEDVDQHLESIEDNIDEVATAGGEGAVNAPAASEAEEEPVRAQADQVFTIFAVLIGIAALAIALLLGTAMRVQNNRSLV